MKDALAVGLLLPAWFLISSANNVLSKYILIGWPHPLSMTFVQLLSIFVYLRPVIRFFGIRQVQLNRRLYLIFLLPLAFGKFLASVSSHASLSVVSVSYTHTIKSLMPLFVVLLQRIFFAEMQTVKIYVSLVPIVGGVFITSITEAAFSWPGLLFALLSTFTFALLQIFSKRLMSLSRMSAFQLLSMLSFHAFVFFLPIWLLVEFPGLASPTAPDLPPHLLPLLALDGLLCFGQNLIAFMLLSRVSPLSYSVANVSKRVAIIGFSLLTFRNPVTASNLLGMMIALGGLFYYNKCKLDEARGTTKHYPEDHFYVRDRRPLLPVDARLSAARMSSGSSSSLNSMVDKSNALFGSSPNGDLKSVVTFY